jgi:hypothetical protein
LRRFQRRTLIDSRRSFTACSRKVSIWPHRHLKLDLFRPHMETTKFRQLSTLPAKYWQRCSLNPCYSRPASSIQLNNSESIDHADGKGSFCAIKGRSLRYVTANNTIYARQMILIGFILQGCPPPHAPTPGLQRRAAIVRPDRLFQDTAVFAQH